MPGIPFTLQNGISTAAGLTATASVLLFNDADSEELVRACRRDLSVLGVIGCVRESSGNMGGGSCLAKSCWPTYNSQ
jgi:hypothetical protein